jgi:hypothetical protein
VYGNAWVSGDAQVSGNAQVSGDAQVYGDAQVSGDARVSGDAPTTPLYIQGLYWPVTVCTNRMIIGCQDHLITEWDEFDAASIADMARNATKFWADYKALIFGLIAARS